MIDRTNIADMKSILSRTKKRNVFDNFEMIFPRLCILYLGHSHETFNISDRDSD